MIYIHIPFCRQACTYCDFHFSVNHERLDEMVEALVKEIQLRKDYLASPVVNSVYFGGGTPSLLNASQLNRIFEAINKNFSLSGDAEVTLEANPDDLTEEKQDALRSTPINRLSIGVQSFFDEDLQLMNRAHNAYMAEKSILIAAEKGFNNLTIDLIYGIPGLSEERWQQNIDKAFSLPVNHLSCYALTVEKKTPLDKMIREGKIREIDENTVAKHFEMLMKSAALNNFEHYEISNFAKNGMYARHNSSYWKNIPYLGIGPSAHSYNGETRQWNISSNAAYIQAIRANKIPSTVEHLTTENKYNEYILTRLRTKWGVDLEYIKEKFGDEFKSDFFLQVSGFVENGDVLFTGNRYTLSHKGKFIADRIAAKIFR